MNDSKPDCPSWIREAPRRRFSRSQARRFFPPHPGPTAVELRSADFSPHPRGTRKSAGSRMNSAFQVHRDSLNSTAVDPASGERVSLSLPGEQSRPLGFLRREAGCSLSMNRKVGQASRLPPSATPTERNRSRWRARWAGETPALHWARSGSWSQCMRQSEWRLSLRERVRMRGNGANRRSGHRNRRPGHMTAILFRFLKQNRAGPCLWRWAAGKFRLDQNYFEPNRVFERSSIR